MVIKLKLPYIKYVNNLKMKLSIVLRYLVYKRRKQKFIDNIKSALGELGLVTYLKVYERCDISIIKVDDMIIIR